MSQPSIAATLAMPARLARGLEGPVPARCWLLLAPIAVLFIFGIVRLRYNLPVFRDWIREDGLVEWVTFAGLLGMAALSFGRALATGARNGAWLVLGIAFLFGAMEEISWGQRVFGWHSPDWFLRYNAQDETNLHNLVFSGVKVNRLVFGKMLGIFLAFYFLAMPVLYRRATRVREWFDRHALPVPRNYQALLAVLAWGFSEAGRAIVGKSGELQELGMVFVLALVLLHPANPAAGGAASTVAATARAFAGRWRALTQAWLPARVRFLLLAAVLLVAEFTLFRLVFAAAFEPPGLIDPVREVVWDRGATSVRITGPGMVPAADVAQAWTLGLRFDLRIALLLLLPLALLGWVRPLDPSRSRAARRGWIAYLAVATTCVFTLHAVDLGHYAYEGARLNATLLDHMREARLAAGMVWETYPVMPILVVLGLLVAVTVSVLARWLPIHAEPFPASRLRRRAVSAAVVLLYVFGVHGQWSQYPLRWSNAFFSPNRYITALASNPLQTLFDTWRSPLAPAEPLAACEAQAQLAPHLGLAPCAAPPASFARYVASDPPGAVPPNIVIVFLESFSAYKTGAMGNPLKPTPHFDALAESSLLFTRFYSATRPTARSIFSSLFGIPDVSPGRSASRNPRTVRQHTLVNAFDGYRKHYFIGGSASWGNIRGMLNHNVPDLQLHEGEHSDLPGNDVWGTSDLHLFQDAHRVLSAESGPFIAFIQTSGNHRPYTIPEDNAGFKRTALPAEVLLQAGFEEPDAYDGMRFIDHALGHYLALAAAAPYYADTIFAFYGDHGMPARRFPLHEYQVRQQHVPLVLHATRWLGTQGRKVDDVVSDIDVLPTLARLAGVGHLNTTLGRDLLAERPEASRFAFLSTGEALGLVDRGYAYGRDPVGRESLHRAREDGSFEAEDLAARDPERLQRMAQLTQAMERSAAWLLQHNPPWAHAPPADAPAD